MKKSEMIEQVANATNLSKKVAGEAIEAYENALKNAIKSDDTYRIAGLCTLKAVHKPARTGRNPRTGEPLMIAPKTVVKASTAADFN